MMTHGRTVVLERREMMCSVCGGPLETGEELYLDRKAYDPYLEGHDWSWHHRRCEDRRGAAALQAPI